VVSADSVETQLNLQIASILAISTDSCAADPANTVIINITPLPTGNTQSNNCQTVGITTNASGGYELSIETSSSTLNHNPVLTPQATIASIGTTPTALISDTWGFAIPKTQTNSVNLVSSFVTNFDSTYATEVNLPSSSAKYRNVPLSSTKFAETDTYSSSTDNYTLYFAANVPGTKPSGTYQTTIIYTGTAIDLEPIIPTVAIVPDIASTVSPTGNGTGTSGVLDNGPQFSLYAASGMNFGNDPSNITVSIGGRFCTNIVVNSVGTAITCSGPTSGMTAGEKKVLVNGLETTATVTYDSTNYPTLQSLTGGSGTCSGTGATPVIYRDARDSQLYYVAKLADNKCWMLDNLKYKPNGDTSGTNQPGFTAEQQVNTGTYLTVDGASNNTSPNLDIAKYFNPIIHPYCYNSIDKSLENITKCGLFYNFYTATAGTAPQSSHFSGQNATGSICPANWRLPTGGPTTSDFGVLDIAGSGTGATTTPPSQANLDLWWPTGIWRGVFSNYYNSSLTAQGSSGSYWSSSTATNWTGFFLHFYSLNVYPGTTNNARYLGMAVRCVL